MTDEEFAAAQQQVNDEAARRAAAALAARAEKLKPLTDLMASDAWSTIRAQVADCTTAAMGEVFWPQVDALRQIVSLLDQQFRATPAPAASPAA